MLHRPILAVLCSFGLTLGASARPQELPAPAETGPDAELQLGPDGLGPVRAGMSVAEAERALDLPLAPDAPVDTDEESLAEWRACHYESTPELPGVTFMVSGGRIARVDVDGGDWSTTGGVRIGTPEAEVLRRYPGTAVRPHPYVGFGHYLLVEAHGPDGRLEAILFETDGRTVTSFRSGARAAVGLVEGCL